MLCDVCGAEGEIFFEIAHFWEIFTTNFVIE